MQKIKYFSGSVVAVSVLYFLWVIWFYITRDYPLEYREGSVFVQMSHMLAGTNPYSMESHPVAMNGYGILLGILTYPFAALFGLNFTGFRLVSNAMLLGSTALIYLVFRRERYERATAALAGLCFLALLVRSSAIAARPDAIGIFILLAALTALHLSGYSARGFYLSIALCCLGWLAKPYFIVGGGVVCLYAFFRHSRALGLRLGVCFAFGLALLVTAMNWLFPMYLTDTFFIHSAAAGNSVPHLLSQLEWILLREGPLLLACIAGFAVIGRQSSGSIFSWQLAISILVFLKMGLHEGSREYSIHLVTPFLILASAPLWKKREAAFSLLLVVQLLLNLPSLPKDRTAEWAAIEAALGTTPFLNNPTTVYLAVKHGLPVYDSGQSEYFKLGAAPANPRSAEVIEQQSKFDRDLSEKLAAQKFGLVLQTVGGSGIFQQWDLVGRYKLAGHLIGYCGVEDWPAGAQNWPIEFWEPIRN